MTSYLGFLLEPVSPHVITDNTTLSFSQQEDETYIQDTPNKYFVAYDIIEPHHGIRKRLME